MIQEVGYACSALEMDVTCKWAQARNFPELFASSSTLAADSQSHVRGGNLHAVAIYCQLAIRPGNVRGPHSAVCRLLLGGVLAAYYVVGALCLRQLALDDTRQAYLVWPNYGWCLGIGSALLWLLVGLFSCCARSPACPLACLLG